MATLGGMHIASTQVSGEQKVSGTAVACELNSPLASDMNIDVSDGWCISGVRGGSILLARQANNMTYDTAKEHGIRALMEALDVACVEDNIACNLSSPSDNFFVLHKDGSKATLSIVQTINQPIGIRLEIGAVDESGKVISKPEPPRPSWHKSFRYYRLSQVSSDIYEAYRNLYLAFESLLQSVYPRGRLEREGEWVRRCLKLMHEAHGLGQFVASECKSPNDYLFGVLYESTRCNLFHSQRPNAIIPYYQIDTSKLREAYDTLLRLWRSLAARFLGTNSGGAVITYGGFRALMDGTYSAAKLDVLVTADNSPQSKEDVAISPKGFSTERLHHCRYGGEISPGVTATYIAVDEAPSRLGVINRMGLTLDDNLVAIASLPRLTLEGIDQLKVQVFHRLIQANQPRTIF